MANKKPVESQSKQQKMWRVRIWAVVSLLPLMTVLSPISPSHTPTINTAKASDDIFQKEIIVRELSVTTYKDFAEVISRITYNWNAEQFKCLKILWGKESAWNPESDNPNSSAFGIAQMLKEKSTNPYIQIQNGLRYIEHRYDNPCNAWDFWQKEKYY